MKTIKLQCHSCGCEFEKSKGEYNRRVRLGKTHFYCNLTCSGKSEDNKKHISRVRSDYPVWELNQPKRYDEYSGFRVILKRIKHNEKRKNCYLTLQDLKKQWDSQDGICPFTQYKMDLKLFPKTGSKSPQIPYQASLDRIDNSKPYEVGNIRFISLIANYARNTFTDLDLIKFCVDVAKSHC